MLEIPFGGQILAIFCGFRPVPDSSYHRGTSKRHLLHRKHVFRAIIDFSATRCSGRTKKPNHSISVMCEGAPVQPIVMIVGTVRDLADTINCANVCIDRFNGFGLRNGQSWGLLRKPRWPLPLCVVPVVHTHLKACFYS